MHCTFFPVNKNTCISKDCFLKKKNENPAGGEEEDVGGGTGGGKRMPKKATAKGKEVQQIPTNTRYRDAYALSANPTIINGGMRAWASRNGSSSC